MTEITRFNMDMDGSMEPSENGRWVRYEDVQQPKQEQNEPVALVAEVHTSRYTIEWTNGPLPEGTKLYTTPQRKPLTREDIDRLYEKDCFSGNVYEITAEIEYAHGIKE